MPERTLPITSQEDLILSRQATREVLAELGFGLADQTRAATAVSEIVRNVLMFAKRGNFTIQWEESRDRTSVEIIIEDQGPGIVNVDRIMMDGVSSTMGSGMGIVSAQRLMHTFDIRTIPGKGTRVMMSMSRRDI